MDFVPYILDFFRGIRDSLLGIIAINKIDQALLVEPVNVVQQTASPKTSYLSRKRTESGTTVVPDEENTVYIAKQKVSVTTRLTQCTLMNGVFGYLAYGIAFYGIQPGLKFLYITITGSSHIYPLTGSIWRFLSHMYFILVLLGSRVLNLLWFQDIAEASYRKVRGRPQTDKLGSLIADNIFTIVLQALFFIQALCAVWFVKSFFGHVLADVVYVAHMILLHSMYTFEYRWYMMGWPVHKRLSYMENHWPYFFGFGFFQGCLSYFIPSYYAGTFFLASVFPVMIISANESRTVPKLVDCPFRIFRLAGHLTDVLLKEPLKYRSYYCYIGKFVVVLSRFLKFLKRLYTPAFYIIMSDIICLKWLIDFCKRNRWLIIVSLTTSCLTVTTYFVLRFMWKTDS